MQNELYTSGESMLYKRHTANVMGGIQYIDEGKGHPILFLHGALSNSNTWRNVIPVLSKKYRCIAIDLPLGGHYLPVSDRVDVTPVGIAKIIHACIESLSLEKVTIVSNDTGGAYAQVFASLFPDSIDKLIFSNCEVLDVFPPLKFKYLVWAVRIPGFTFLLSRIFSFKKMLKSNLVMGLLSSKITTEELYGLYLVNFIHNKSVRRNFADAARHWSPVYTRAAAEKLKDLKTPVLILWGDADVKLFPVSLGETLKGIFQDATLIKIAGARTYIQEDQPEQTSAEILKFMVK
jgi:pimeloyl-ACP methyl ester carboxylesterase